MTTFRYERARDADSAVALLAQEPNGVFLAGGTNLVDHLRLGVRQPYLLVDISHLPYDRIEPLPDGGIRIGAMVRNSDLVADRTIRCRYPLEEDPHVNPIGVKGIGEIGIVGTAAAIANAVYHATGIRVRDLPITLAKLLR